MRQASPSRRLLALVLIYAGASLIHFVHNAEFVAEYPNLPISWTRGGVYGAWVAMTAVGAAGVLLVLRGFQAPGLLALGVYGLLGLASLGHFLLAPFAAHTAAMASTILFEVGAASLLLVDVLRLGLRGHAQSSPLED